MPGADVVVCTLRWNVQPIGNRTEKESECAEKVSAEKLRYFFAKNATVSTIVKR